ncbi:MAG: PAS domain S-box protein [Cyclobacteriaceae bacterium]
MSDLLSQEELLEKINMLERRVARERTARKEAERLLETKSEALFQANQQLSTLNKTLEKKVASRTETMSSLINNLHAGVLLNDEKGKIVLVNKDFLEIFRIPLAPHEVIGLDQRDSANLVKHLLVAPEKFIDIIDRCLSGNRHVISYELAMKDGRVIDCDFIPVMTESEFIGHLWQVRDVTDQRTIQKKIVDSEEKYRGIIENMELGLLEVDNNHIIQRAYSWFCDMTGYTEEELVGQNAVKILLPEELQAAMDTQDKKRIRGEHSVYETKILKKNGEAIWVLISGAPFYDTEGNMIGSIGIHYDITARKNLEYDLTKARNQAEQAREAEKQFLANMSHEIRNPINAIVGMTNLLYDTQPSAKQLEHLDRIKYASDMLMGLISGILDISKIESGNFELVERQIDIRNGLEAIIEIAGFKTQDDDVKLRLEWDQAIDFDIIADPTVLNQIFLNLLNNALKFTKQGEVVVRCRLLADTEEGVNLLFVVKDTGIGIPPEKRKSIFESFNQGDKETKLKYGGTGLGLAIVKKLVSKYGGKIVVDSEVGVGSTFQFNCHFKRIKKSSMTLAKKTSFLGKTCDRILIVEDNKINQAYLSGILDNWHIQYDVANHGEEALAFIEKNAYDLILMDIRMPIMDGYETTIRIRTDHSGQNEQVPIVALTASALVDEKERALAAGMNFHLTKPFTPDQLAHVFKKFNLLVEVTEVENTSFDFGEGLDQEYLRDFYEDDIDRVKLMFTIFLKNIDGEMADLQSQFENQEWGSFSKIAHKIKPNFAMVGLTEISELMLALEGVEKRHTPLARVPEILLKAQELFVEGRKNVENVLSKLD